MLKYVAVTRDITAHNLGLVQLNRENKYNYGYNFSVHFDQD